MGPATVCNEACSRMRWSLQPSVMEAVTLSPTLSLSLTPDPHPYQVRAKLNVPLHYRYITVTLPLQVRGKLNVPKDQLSDERTHSGGKSGLSLALAAPACNRT